MAGLLALVKFIQNKTKGNGDNNANGNNRKNREENKREGKKKTGEREERKSTGEGEENKEVRSDKPTIPAPTTSKRKPAKRGMKGIAGTFMN